MEERNANFAREIEEKKKLKQKILYLERFLMQSCDFKEALVQVGKSHSDGQSDQQRQVELE